jgi:hypothetical protein
MPDIAGEDEEALPKTRSEEKRWLSEVRKRLPDWVAGTARPVIANALSAEELAARIRAEGEKLFIGYEATATGSEYNAPTVILEFGLHSTGEPSPATHPVWSTGSLSRRLGRSRCTLNEPFGRRRPRIHVFCKQTRMRGDRFARHWHDVARLDGR